MVSEPRPVLSLEFLTAQIVSISLCPWCASSQSFNITLDREKNVLFTRIWKLHILLRGVWGDSQQTEHSSLAWAGSQTSGSMALQSPAQALGSHKLINTAGLAGLIWRKWCQTLWKGSPNGNMVLPAQLCHLLLQ